MSHVRVTDFAIAETHAGHVRLSCRVAGGGLPESLWIEVRARDADMLSDNGNWAAVALLYPAMRIGSDLHVDAALSPQLHDALAHDLQAFLVHFDPALTRIAVTCSAAAENRPSGPLVATGFSAGVDSFATLVRYDRARVHPDLAVSALAVFNVGAFGRNGDAHFARAMDRCDVFAAQERLRAIAVDSNMDALYRAPVLGRPGFEKTNTFRNVAAALALENGVRRYYVSSSFSPAEIGVRATYNPAYLDPILLPLLSTERLVFLSACAALTRLEKTRLVADVPAAASLLDVCTRPHERIAGAPPNCSHCGKCIRTLFTLEALGRLDAFAGVFDVGLFRSRRDRFLDELRASAAAGNSLDGEVLMLMGGGQGPGRRRRWFWF